MEARECALGTGADRILTSFLDQTFEWEKTYFYRGTVVSAIENAGKAAIEVEGEDTPEVKVFAHDVFPPAVPAGLQAVLSGPGQQAFIDLIWNPVADADLDGYNVYRHEAGAAAVKVNSEVVKTPAFRDTQVVVGKTYFYSVAAVDERGNESGNPKRPVRVCLRQVPQGLKLSLVPELIAAREALRDPKSWFAVCRAARKRNRDGARKVLAEF